MICYHSTQLHTQKMAIFYPQGLLLIVLLIVISECRGIETVNASPEEDVVLPCFNASVMDPKSCYRVKLMKSDTNTSQVKVILARPKIHNLRDAKRVKWQTDGNGQMSLYLTKSQKSDEGLYICEIWKGWDCVSVKTISLKVKDCKILQAVKAAPNTPVNLTCPVDTTSGQGPQNISWAIVKGGNPVSIISKRLVIDGTSLAIQSVDYKDNNWYRCNYLIGETLPCFEIYLGVQEENVVPTTDTALTTSVEMIWETSEEGRNGVVIAVVVASIVIGTVIMAALIGLFIYRRCNPQRITQQTQRHPAGTTVDGYQIVSLTPSEDRTNQDINSLYQHIADEDLCTFRY
ncbi:uncharacterized protein LOC116691051 [Etheostoma spectabile]|uniref:uncharacterized protein LOC116691051 n=1 Tax=Etheostoma spectabile TaxID=54343 RepID=UPI0013AEA39B|nr:uncharacterized protein LOC116691051 [Etheostoma spectabile]